MSVASPKAELIICANLPPPTIKQKQYSKDIAASLCECAEFINSDAWNNIRGANAADLSFRTWKEYSVSLIFYEVLIITPNIMQPPPTDSDIENLTIEPNSPLSHLRYIPNQYFIFKIYKCFYLTCVEREVRRMNM